MIDGIRFKVCGLTSIVDAEFVDRCGADYLGFIFHPESPRNITLAQYHAMAPRLPERRKVAVSVEPTVDALARLGQASEAQKRARDFDERYPGSAHQRRVESATKPAP